MSDDTLWERRVMGEPARATEEDLYLTCKWLVFEIRCEQFDRTLPGVMRHGDWIPIEEGRRRSVRFADALYKALALDRRRDVGTARYVQRMSYQSQQDALQHVPKHIRDDVNSLADGPRYEPSRNPRDLSEPSGY